MNRLIIAIACLFAIGCATADQGQAQRANDQQISGLTILVNPIGSAAPKGGVDWNRLYDQADSADAKVELFTEMIEYIKSTNIPIERDFQALFDSAENDEAKAAVIKELAVQLEVAELHGYGHVVIDNTTVNVTVSTSGTSDQGATGGAQTPQNETPITLEGNALGADAPGL